MSGSRARLAAQERHRLGDPVLASEGLERVELLLERNDEYQTMEVLFDHDRGKFWLYLDCGRDVLCIEAPCLRALVAAYDAQLAASGLDPVTPDGTDG